MTYQELKNLWMKYQVNVLVTFYLYKIFRYVCVHVCVCMCLAISQNYFCVIILSFSLKYNLWIFSLAK